MFAVLHSDIDFHKSGLLYLTGQPYCKKSRSAKDKDGIINLFLRNYLVDRYSWFTVAIYWKDEKLLKFQRIWSSEFLQGHHQEDQRQAADALRTGSARTGSLQPQREASSAAGDFASLLQVQKWLVRLVECWLWLLLYPRPRQMLHPVLVRAKFG